MNKIIVILLLLTSITQLHAQDVFDKISKSTCKCLEKKSNPQMDFQTVFQGCFQEVLIDNMEEMMKYYNVQSPADLNVQDLSNKITIKMLKDCDIFYKNFSNDSLNQSKKTYTTDAALKCDKLKNGKYYSLNPNKSNSFDTTHVIIDQDKYTEIMGPNNTYSKLSIKWTGNCKFQLTFIESNDPFKSTLSEKGDKYEYEIVQDHPEMFVLKFIIHGDAYYKEYYKE